MRVLFLGGPGNISESTIAYLLSKGTEVAALKRSRGGLFGFDGRITVFVGDRDRPQDLGGALGEFQPDIVVDATCFDLAQAETLIAALRAQPCRRLIFISTADIYGYPLSRLPMREDDPWGEPEGEYAANKLAIERRYQEALTDGEPGLTIVRPGYALGKVFSLTAFGIRTGAHLVSRIRQGKPVLSPGDGTTLLDAGAAHNTGLMLARICFDDDTIGEAYNLAHDRAITYDQYLQAFGEAVGSRVDIVHIPTDFIYSLGREEVEHSLLGGLTRHNLHFCVDKFRAQFPDFVWEYSLADAARDFIAYQESVGGFEGADEPTFDDRVVEAWRAALPGLRQSILNGLGAAR